MKAIDEVPFWEVHFNNRERTRMRALGSLPEDMLTSAVRSFADTMGFRTYTAVATHSKTGRIVEITGAARSWDDDWPIYDR